MEEEEGICRASLPALRTMQGNTKGNGEERRGRKMSDMKNGKKRCVIPDNSQIGFWQHSKNLLHFWNFCVYIRYC